MLKISFWSSKRLPPAFESPKQDITKISGHIIIVRGPLANQEVSLTTPFTSLLKRANKIGVDFISSLMYSEVSSFFSFFIFVSPNPSKERLYSGESKGKMIKGIATAIAVKRKLKPKDLRYSPCKHSSIAFANQCIGGKNFTKSTMFIILSRAAPVRIAVGSKLSPVLDIHMK